jgi:hypothetical protein
VFEHFRRETATEFTIVVLLAECREHRPVIGGIDNDRHTGKILCRRANHRWPANIDLFDDVFRRDAGLRRGLTERIEIHADKIDRRNPVLGDRGHVFGEITAREQTAVHRRMERLDAPVEHFRKVRDGADIGAREASVTNRLRGAASGDQLPAELVQRAGEIDEAGLIGNGEQGAGHRAGLGGEANRSVNQTVESAVALSRAASSQTTRG